MHQSEMIKTVYLTITSLLLWTSYVVTGLPDDAHPLELSEVKVSAHNATFKWSGLDLSDITKCYFSYGVVNTTKKQLKVSEFMPQNYTFELMNLNAATTYEIYLSCEKGQEVFRSKQLRILTTKKGEVVDADVTDPVSQEVSTGSPDGSTERPTVQKEKVSEDLNPVDVAVGVVFGALAVGIVCTILYYVVKKVRRQQRVRRFLQYRQQENDPFPGLEQQDDYGFHM